MAAIITAPIPIKPATLAEEHSHTFTACVCVVLEEGSVAEIERAHWGTQRCNQIWLIHDWFAGIPSHQFPNAVLSVSERETGREKALVLCGTRGTNLILSDISNNNIIIMAVWSWVRKKCDTDLHLTVWNILHLKTSYRDSHNARMFLVVAMQSLRCSEWLLICGC